MNGAITQVGSSRYRVRWRDPDGLNCSRMFDRVTEAQQFLVHVWSSTAVDQPPLTIRPESPTLESVTKAWLKTKQHLAHNTMVGYRTVTDRHLMPLLHEPLSAIRVDDIERLYAQHRLPTARKIRIVLNQVYKYALKHGVVSVNVVPLADMSCKSGELRYQTDRSLPSVADVQRIAGQASDCYRAFILAAALSGLRLGELSGLVKDNVNLSERRIRVVQQWNGAAKEFTEPKASRRPPSSGRLTTKDGRSAPGL